MMRNPEEIEQLVISKLQQYQTPYRPIDHEPEGRCVEVSRLRGNPVHAAAKVLLVKGMHSKRQGDYFLCVLPGDMNIDFANLARQLGKRTAYMASEQSVNDLLGFRIGAVPPFSFNSKIPVLVDASLLENEFMYYSPGKLDRSFEMKTENYKSIILQESGKILSFAIIDPDLIETTSPTLNI